MVYHRGDDSHAPRVLVVEVGTGCTGLAPGLQLRFWRGQSHALQNNKCILIICFFFLFVYLFIYLLGGEGGRCSLSNLVKQRKWDILVSWISQTVLRRLRWLAGFDAISLKIKEQAFTAAAVWHWQTVTMAAIYYRRARRVSQWQQPP